MERILVTGASGFLGSHLVKQLADSGYQIRALVRNRSLTIPTHYNNVQLVSGDICQPGTLSSATKNIDYVIHCAGLVKACRQNDFYRVNADGTQHLLSTLCANADEIKRFVHISSLAAIGPQVGNQPHVSIQNAHPVSHYGKSKLEAESIVTDYSNRIPTTIVRPPAIYGPGDKACLILFKLVAWHLWPSFLSHNKKLSIIYVTDAVNAIISAMKNDQNSGNCYFIDDGHHYSMHDLIAVLKEIMAVKRLFNIRISPTVLACLATLIQPYARLTKQPTMLSKDKLKELMQQDWTCNNQLATERLNWAAQINWKTGATKTLNWYKQRGWIKSD